MKLLCSVHNFTRKHTYPNNLERQKVKYAMVFFSDRTSSQCSKCSLKIMSPNFKMCKPPLNSWRYLGIGYPTTKYPALRSTSRSDWPSRSRFTHRMTSGFFGWRLNSSISWTTGARTCSAVFGWKITKKKKENKKLDLNERNFLLWSLPRCRKLCAWNICWMIAGLSSADFLNLGTKTLS